jgi:hypothetical protein
MKWLLAVVLLLAISVCLAADETQPPAFEQQLASLAKAPLVSTLDVTEPETPQSEIPNPRSEVPPRSLEDLAQQYGLKLFNQEGVQVIGPAEKIDFTDLLSGNTSSWVSDPFKLISSLSDGQIAAMGSPQGLPVRSLTPQQRAFLKSSFSDDYQVNEPGRDSAVGDGTKDLPIEDARLIAWLEVSDVNVRFPEGGDKSIPGSPEVPLWGVMTPTEEANETTAGFREVSNELKRSDLDYSQPALQVPVSITGRIDLRSMIDIIVRETGLNLRASPGSDKVYLYILASKVPAGSLLKAVSLATTGTWRRFEDAYVFTVDLMGIGQVDALAAQLSARVLEDYEYSGFRAISRMQDLSVLTMLPFVPGTQFQPTREQVQAMINMGSEAALPWNALTPYQQALIERQLSESNPDRLSEPRDDWRTDFSVTLNLAAEFPDSRRIKLSLNQIFIFFVSDGGGGGGVAPSLTIVPSGTQDPQTSTWNASARYHLSINKPLRGYVCKPSRFERPVSLIGTLTRNGFNALYLRVFSDGATAFPSKQFPRMARFDRDYLEQVIALAHANDIEVYAVVDTLRWSDGRKDAWVSKSPELLDYDILGRTRPQFAGTILGRFSDQLCGSDEEKKDLVEFGEGLNCDAVSPFQPEVGKKLLGLLEELAAYDVDGLVLDYTTMRHAMVGAGGEAGELYAAGRPGYNSAACHEFFRLYGADPIDIGVTYDSMTELPLQPMVQACRDLRTAWTEFYRKGCDDLLEVLAKQWKALHPPNPHSSLITHHSSVRVLCTFRAGRESHDWPRFKGLVDGVFISGVDFPGTAGHYYGLPSMPIVRASDKIGTLRFAALLASGLGYDVSGFPPELVRESPWETDGVILDFTTAGRRKTDYLRIIEPPESSKNTSAQSP